MITMNERRSLPVSENLEPAVFRAALQTKTLTKMCKSSCNRAVSCRKMAKDEYSACVGYKPPVISKSKFSPASVDECRKTEINHA